MKGLRATGGNGWFGRYLMLRGYGCFLSYSSYHWTEWGGTPLWLEVKGHDWSILPSIKNHMANSGIPCESSDDGLCCIPLTLLTGVEREAVIDYVLVQLDRIIAYMDSSRFASIPLSGFENRLLTYIRPLRSLPRK